MEPEEEKVEQEVSQSDDAKSKADADEFKLE